VFGEVETKFAFLYRHVTLLANNINSGKSLPDTQVQLKKLYQINVQQ